ADSPTDTETRSSLQTFSKSQKSRVSAWALSLADSASTTAAMPIRRAVKGFNMIRSSKEELVRETLKNSAPGAQTRRPGGAVLVGGCRGARPPRPPSSGGCCECLVRVSEGGPGGGTEPDLARRSECLSGGGS